MSNPVELLATDLNPQGGVFCPSPKADMKIWNSHPKVYKQVKWSVTTTDGIGAATLKRLGASGHGPTR
ncbi:MAG: hypothetical protein RLZZ239_2364 [Pseudomonadota bacterium]